MRVGRNYQLECVSEVQKAFRDGKRGVGIEVFTGGGKGWIIAYLAKLVFAKGKRVLVLVNRDNLCEQLFESLVEQGLYPVMERGLDHASPFASYGSGQVSSIVVASIQTLQGSRLQKWPRNHFDLVICDEVHFSAANTFKTTLDHFESAYHIGMTATMQRHDKKGLWKGFDGGIVFAMPLTEGISEGWLVPFDFEELPVPICISDEVQKKRMFTEEDESNIFSTNDYLPRLFAEAAARVKDKHALFFWPNCDSSMAADAAFKSLGIESRHVEGPGGPARMNRATINELFEWFRTPGPKSLHNADLLSYGADFPMIDCVGIMRLSRSIPMLKQRLGRGTRPFEAFVDNYPTAELRREAIARSPKPSVKVLDLMLQLGEVQNKFADATLLITEDEAERRYLREEMKKAGVPISMEDLEHKLTAKRQTDKEAQLAKLAEDAANAARRRGVKSDRPLYIADIALKYNPNHKPASPGFIQHVRRLCQKAGVELFDGPYTGYQLFKVKNRIEFAEMKQREEVLA